MLCPGPFATPGKRAGTEGLINTWLAENVYKPFSKPVALTGPGQRVSGSFEEAAYAPFLL